MASVAGGFAVLFAGLAIGSGSKPDSQETFARAIPGTLLIGAPFALSAFVGHNRIEQCEKAHATWAEVVREKEEAARVAAEAQRKEEQERAEAARLAVEEDRLRAEAEAREAEALAERQRKERAERVSANRDAPLQSATIEIANGYIESIFRLTMVLPDSDEEIAAVADQRVASVSTQRFSDALVGRVNQRVFLRVQVMSMGEWRTFGVRSVYIKPGGTYVVHYDWDTATAEFRVQVGWK